MEEQPGTPWSTAVISAGTEVLRSRYQLVNGPLNTRSISGQPWLGIDKSEQSDYLIKLWEFQGSAPDHVRQALFDVELRTLYRLGSSPGAESTTLVLRDAGVDRKARCFVMVFEAPGYENLADALGERAKFPWLSGQDGCGRRALWEGLQRIASGIRLLHGQNVLHRDVRAESVFFNRDLGPGSLRLGGFEWSVRLSSPDGRQPPDSWSSPPEFFTPAGYGYRPDTDWFGFGMLAVRMLLNVESYANNPPLARYENVLKHLNRSGSRLSDLERAFLQRLVSPDTGERIDHDYDVHRGLQEIIDSLEGAPSPSLDTRPLILAVDPGRNIALVEAARACGFIPDKQRPKDEFNQHNLTHTTRLTEFLEADLRTARVYFVPGQHCYLLLGENLILMLASFRYLELNTEVELADWAVAYCTGVGELRSSSAHVELRPGAIMVRTGREVRTNRALRQAGRSWKPCLPAPEEGEELRASLARFHDFIRCTNQIELLIRDSEIFRFRVTASTTPVFARSLR